MRISIITLGSRGDMQPYIALAKALKARGHDVLLAAPRNFADWAEEFGLKFHPIDLDIEAFLKTKEVRQILAGQLHKVIPIWNTKVIPMLRDSLDATWEAAKDAELIIYYPTVLGAPSIAEVKRIPRIMTSVMPTFATSEFAAVTYPRDFGPFLNRWTWRLLLLSRIPYAGTLNKWRKEKLGLGKVNVFQSFGRSKGPSDFRAFMPISASVLQRPKDWADGIELTGYMFLDSGDDWQPDQELQRFLDAGLPPVYIGFGSMTTKDPVETGRRVVAAVKRAGLRAVIARGWGGMESDEAGDDIHIIDSAPHDKLFPLMSAVVHHGGAGSTAAGLRAGKPTLVCPFMGDQPFWGRLVDRRGFGPKRLPLARVTEENLAARMTELTTNEAFKVNTAAVAAQIAQEDGIGAAIEFIEQAGGASNTP